MKFAAFDIETKGLWGDFYSGSIVSTNVRYFGTGLVPFVDALRNLARSGHTLIAHNAEYDIGASLWQAKESVDIFYYSSQFNRALWLYDPAKKPVEIWDSLNLSGGVELAQLGKAVALEKYPTPQILVGEADRRYLWKCEPHNSWECIECYNLRDAEIVHKFVTDFSDYVESQGLHLKRTLGGNAVALWQALDRGQMQTLKAPIIKEFARKAYHPGRVELFKPGLHSGVYTADRASFYLSIMRDNPMPDLGHLRYVREPKAVELENLHGIIEATVSVPKRYVGPLPVKMPDNHVYFPWGTFRGHWTIAEINAAIARGTVLLKVHRLAYTDKTVSPFQVFTTGLALLRREYAAKGDMREFTVKTLANSLPGRLGMREEQEASTYRVRDGFLEDSEVFGNDVIWTGGNKVLVTKRTVKMLSKANNVLWAASINAFGRIRMLEDLEAAGKGLIYCDTDSMMSLAPLPTNGHEPGQLRDTGHYRYGEFYGPKLYRLWSGDEAQSAVARGVPKQLALQFIEKGEISFQAPVGIIMGVRLGVAPTHWQVISRTNRNRFGNRVLAGTPTSRQSHGWADSEPPFVEFTADPPADPRSRPSVSR